MYQKSAKCPNFTWFLAEKLSKYPNFYDTCPKNLQNSPILHDFCPKNARIWRNNCPTNIFSRILGGHVPPAHPPSPIRLRPMSTLTIHYNKNGRDNFLFYRIFSCSFLYFPRRTPFSGTWLQPALPVGCCLHGCPWRPIASFPIRT